MLDTTAKNINIHRQTKSWDIAVQGFLLLFHSQYNILKLR